MTAQELGQMSQVSQTIDTSIYGQTLSYLVELFACNFIDSFVYAAPATAPQNLSASAADANSLTVSWSDPDTPYGVIISYTVTYNISGGSTSFVTESQSVTLENLDEYTVYAIYVAASTRIGTGPSTQVYGRTDQASKSSLLTIYLY